MKKHWFPWTYFRPLSWKIYYHCPEIRWHLNEASKCRVKKWAWVAVAGPFVLTFMGVGLPLVWVSSWLHSFYPEDADVDAIISAHKVLSVDEIRRRLGKKPSPNIYQSNN